MPFRSEREHELNKQIIAQNIDRDPVGRKLTPEARAEAIEIGTTVFETARIGNGDAAQAGIKHVTSKVFKK